MEVTIKKVEPMRVAFIRHVGPYTAVGPVWTKLMSWAGPRGLIGWGTRCLGACYDDPRVTPPDKIRYDACITVGPDVQPSDEIGVQELAGGDYAVTMHRGPYENLGQTYSALSDQWLPQSGREPADKPCLEVYVNNPQTTAPDDLLTEIYLPLATG